MGELKATMPDARTPVEDEVSSILFRGAIYQGVALAFEYPSHALREQLKARWNALLRCSLPWPEGIRQSLQQATALLETIDGEALEKEHMRLFGPDGRCSLRETSYGDAARLLGKAANLADISGFYLAFGVHAAPVAAPPEDHISLELEFMSILGLKEAYALTQGWNERLQISREAQRKFVEEHVGTWIDALAEEVRTSDPHPFYAVLSELVRQLVDAEVARLKASPLVISGSFADPEMGGDTLQCPRATAGDQVQPILPNA